MYLCRKSQFGYYEAGYFLMEQFCLFDLIDLFYNLAISSIAIDIGLESLKKTGVLKGKRQGMSAMAFKIREEIYEKEKRINQGYVQIKIGLK